jgi:hypothetical protein
MHQSHILSTLVISLVLGTPACGSKFVSLGDEDAGDALGAGGANSGAGGALPSTGGTLPAFGGDNSVGGNGPCQCTDPKPAIASVHCSDGSISGPECLTDPNGECAWFIRGCPVVGLGGSFGAGGAMPNAGAGAMVAAGGAMVAAGGAMPTAGAAGAGAMVAAGGAMVAAGGAMPNAGAAGAGAMVAAGGAIIIGAGGSSGCVCSGPAPAGPNYLCWDGSIAGPSCDRGPTGACEWMNLSCPAQGVGGSASGAGGAMAAGGSPVSNVVCEYNGAVYTEGQSFLSEDGCNTCFCMAPGVACTKMACPAPLGTGGTWIQ